MLPNAEYLTYICVLYLGTTLTEFALSVTGLPKTVPHPFHDKKVLLVPNVVGFLILTLYIGRQLAPALQDLWGREEDEQEENEAAPRLNP